MHAHIRSLPSLFHQSSGRSDTLLVSPFDLLLSPFYLVVRASPFTICVLASVARHASPVVCVNHEQRVAYSVFVVRRSLFIVRRSSFVVRRSSFVIRSTIRFDCTRYMFTRHCSSIDRSSMMLDADERRTHHRSAPAFCFVFVGLLIVD